MGNIVLLDDLTINKIAAGEVIERPASVVKEMLENSIDAGAKNITIEIKNGGISMIKISDDGCGIAEDDMEIAFERHATSKIRSASDLTKVTTMGFRGEALASIAAVSKVEMVSKKDGEVGHKIVVEGGKVLEFTEAARSNGTTITVENLFYNTPVRYKFMKKDYTEAGYVEDAVTRIALINKDVAIKLVSNGKTVLKTTGNGSLKDVIYSVYGKDISEEVNLVNYNYNNIRVTGAVGNPSIARGNRSNQLFFLNGRYIKDKNLTAAADQAFKDRVPSGRYGFLVLNMEMRPDLVDVNVHPAKLEVRFQDEQEAFKAIYHAIEVALEPKQTSYADVAKKIETSDAEPNYSEIFAKNDINANVAADTGKEAVDIAASDLGMGTPISGTKSSNKQVVDIKSNVKKDGKRVKKGLFSKNKDEEDDDIENDPLAAIYKSRKEQMESMEETDMLKAYVRNMLREQGINKNSILDDEPVQEASKTTSKNTSKTTRGTKKSSSKNDVEDAEVEVAASVASVEAEKINNVAEATDNVEAGSESKAKDTSKELSEADKKINEIDSKDDDELLKESNTMSNQEKIAKFISDYHKSRHYNVEKLLKGVDEIIDETGNATDDDNNGERNVFEDTTEFISRDKDLEKLTTRELNSNEVNELVKSMNKNEEILNSQVTQVIEMASKEATPNEGTQETDDAEIGVEAEVEEKPEVGEKIEVEEKIEIAVDTLAKTEAEFAVKSEIESAENNNAESINAENNNVVNTNEVDENNLKIENKEEIADKEEIENKEEITNKEVVANKEGNINNNEIANKEEYTNNEEIVNKEESTSDEEIVNKDASENVYTNIVANAETAKSEDDEYEIVNPYAIDISNLDDPSNDGNTAAFKAIINNKHDTAEVDYDAASASNVSEEGTEEDDVREVSSEDFKKNVFAKAKDELEKFTSFAGTLISSKNDSQDTQLIDTKKVREAIGEENNNDAPSPETFEDSPEFAAMYKKTFGVEPFSVRKERRLQELEKDKMNATSEFTYATENMNVFEDNAVAEEDEDVIPYKYIGQAFGNYIVVELKNEMYVVDISACKVRLIYEDLKAKYYSEENEENKDSQVLLLPDVIILSKKEQRIAEENTEMFNNAGFIYENFGENTIKLTQVPSVCESLNTKNLFVEILDNLDTVAITDTAEKEEKFISIIASRIALNEIIEADEEQCKEMVSKLLKYKNPFTSTDGKPIAIKMTKYDLDKKFSRR